MNLGKTKYQFQLNCDPQEVSNVIMQWLKENEFTFVNEYGENFYHAKDALRGNRGFQCTYLNNILTVYAWTIGAGGNFVMLESGLVNNICGDYYKSLLSTLFDRLDALNRGNGGAYYYRNATQQPAGYTVVQAANDLNQEVSTRAEKTCVVGFWLSIAGLVLSFFGVIFGFILYFFVFSFGIQGLKTRKRKMAIATLVLAGVSIFISLISLIASVLF